MLEIPKFDSKKELFDFLVENKQTLTAQKMNTVKFTDGIGGINISKSKSYSTKSDNLNEKEINVKVVINTTNILDSHKDVHIPNLWKKSLKENKRIMHLQEHKSNEFDKIIASGDDLHAYVKTMSWKSLGFEKEGNTQALIFDSVVKNSRNAYMFEQYKNGYVDNHSVGMRYVKIAMAINDKDYPTEKEVWDKYYPEIINQKDADNTGYFWAVTEAKVIEGSAVPLGSNPITPTLEVKNEPSNHSLKIEAEQSLQTSKKSYYKSLLN